MIETVAALEFSAGRQDNRWLGAGWAAPEDGFVWSNATVSVLHLPRPGSRQGVILDLDVQPFTHRPDVPFQRVLLAVNGVDVAQRRLRGRMTWRVALPPACLGQEGPLRVMLHCPDACAPVSVGAGKDGRVLGVRLYRAAFFADPGLAQLPDRSGSFSLDGAHHFSWNDAPEARLLEGWGEPEHNHVWALGRRSIVRVPLKRPGRYILLADMLPAVDQTAPQPQRCIVGAAERFVAALALPGRRVLGFALPRVSQDFIDISFDNLGPQVPGDARQLAFMLLGLFLVHAPERVAAPAVVTLPPIADAGPRMAAVTGLSSAALVCHFESLGNLCELGLLQRRLGEEPIGLLRFAGMGQAYLVQGLLDGFPGLGRPDRLDVRVRDDGGYWVIDEAHAMSFQTQLLAARIEVEPLRRKLARNLPFLRRKFFADICAAEKIFVYYRQDALEQEVTAVLAALSLWGEVAMLWVVHDPAHAPGSVSRLGANLVRGYVEASVGKPPYASDGAWLSVLANAWRLLRGDAA